MVIVLMLSWEVISLKLTVSFQSSHEPVGRLPELHGCSVGLPKSNNLHQLSISKLLQARTETVLKAEVPGCPTSSCREAARKASSLIEAWTIE